MPEAHSHTPCGPYLRIMDPGDGIFLCEESALKSGARQGVIRVTQ